MKILQVFFFLVNTNQQLIWTALKKQNTSLSNLLSCLYTWLIIYLFIYLSFSVQLLAEEAVSVDSLDASAAKELLSQAQNQLASASTDVAKAEAQISIEVSEALVKACE